jgi:hypothetical protein
MQCYKTQVLRSLSSNVMLHLSEGSVCHFYVELKKNFKNTDTRLLKV